MDSLERPTTDVYTNEWYRQQFQGLNYHWQRTMSVEADLVVQVRLLRNQVAKMEVDRTVDLAKIGELQERIDKASQVIKGLQGKLNAKVVAA